MGGRVVLFPLPLKGHINPMLQLASMLHSNGFSVSIICTRLNSPNPTDHPHFTFHIISDGLSESEASFTSDAAFFTTLNKRCEEPFKECLSHLVSSVKEELVTCLIADAFWYFTQAVADSLKLRRFVLLPFNISCFLTFLTFHRTNEYISRQDKEAVVAELSPLRIKDLPKMNTQDQTLHDELMLSIRREIRASYGIIFNSFEELESPALAKLEQELSIPIFQCGPFHQFDPTPSPPGTLQGPDHSCISWLEAQPPKSVIYISLGSVISIEMSDFLELAWGIAGSKQPFLWVVRPGLIRGLDGSDELLSDGFMESVSGRGLVVSWAPQQDVLAHPAVGGFLTHGGWNSTLESIYAGVPMICLPFFADQMANARYAREVWRIGLYFEERIGREPIQKAIRRLMVGKEGDEMRGKIECLKSKAKGCLEVGGSSYKSLKSLVDCVGR